MQKFIKDGVYISKNSSPKWHTTQSKVPYTDKKFSKYPFTNLKFPNQLNKENKALLIYCSDYFKSQTKKVNTLKLTVECIFCNFSKKNSKNFLSDIWIGAGWVFLLMNPTYFYKI